MKYTAEWKLKNGAWVQDHESTYCEKIYKIHYIENMMEYSTGVYFTKKAAEADLINYKTAI